MSDPVNFANVAAANLPVQELCDSFHLKLATRRMHLGMCIYLYTH